MNKIQYIKNQTANTQSGFTLVEVMLYLAIVGLVFLIGINAFGGQSGQVRYTDSMRSLQSYVQNQYSQFSSGVMPAAEGCRYEGASRNPILSESSDGSCVQFGKVFLLSTESPTQIQIYDLVARNPKDTNFGADSSIEGQCNSFDYRCLDPSVINEGSPVVYETLWGAEFFRGIEPRYGLFGNSSSPAEMRNNRKPDNIRAFGWIRDPSTNQIVPIVFGGVPSESDQPADLNTIKEPENYRYTENAIKTATQSTTVFPRVALGSEVGSAFCFRSSNGSIGMLTIGIAESQDTVGLELKEGITYHDCSA
jgi:prepilin-type N-terminal cleavage/methylation domain-containing protein